MAIFSISFGILIMVVVLLLVRGTARRSGHIQLPDASTGTSSGQPSEDDSGALAVVEIRTDTVQLAIEVMERPMAYTERVTVETFWSGGSGTAESTVYVRDNLLRMDTTLLTGGEHSYIWYDEDTDYVTLEAGDFTSDAELRIPTYEDILALDQEDITDAGYGDYESTYCIYVVTDDGAGYVTRYWIGTETGLLTACERYWEGELVYRMTTAELTVGQADDTMFLLPDGEQPT